jgi:hypothetical protein
MGESFTQSLMQTARADLRWLNVTFETPWFHGHEEKDHGN